MNTKIWDPENKKKSNIDNGLLDQFIQIVRNCEESNIKNHLTDVEKNKFYILRLSDDIWLQSLNDFDNAELLDLIKFFTLIEMQLDDWMSGEMFERRIRFAEAIWNTDPRIEKVDNIMERIGANNSTKKLVASVGMSKKAQFISLMCSPELMGLENA